MRASFTKIITSVMLASFLLLPVPALASDNQLFAACQQAPNSPICKDKGTTTNPVVHTIHIAADIIALLTGIFAVIIIIISGIAMITSGGNAESVSNSRKRIVGAVIGLVIVAFAWTIVTFLTDKLIA